MAAVLVPASAADVPLGPLSSRDSGAQDIIHDYLVVLDSSTVPRIPVKTLRGVSAVPLITGTPASPGTADVPAVFSFPPDKILFVNCEDGFKSPRLSQDERAEACIVIFYSLDETISCLSADRVQDFHLVLFVSDETIARQLHDELQLRGAPGVELKTRGVFPRADCSSKSDCEAMNTVPSEKSELSVPPPPPQDDTPNTNIALVTLYVLSGVITGLFLLIFGTGIVRAHRHPDRYGPRSEGRYGEARQSRAKGLARAVLDTLPIVRFGSGPRPEDLRKRDIEMHESVDTHHALSTTGPVAIPAPPQLPQPPPPASILPPRAVLSVSSREGGVRQHQCPVCITDFVEDEQLRVLPCHHQFHPDCVDPWLLNVSGSCPLCRIDLHPELAGHQEPVEDSQEEPPHTPTRIRPTNRVSRYLEIARGTSGEERMEALRRLRDEDRESHQSGHLPIVPRAARSMRPELGFNRLRRAVSSRMGSDSTIGTVRE